MSDIIRLLPDSVANQIAAGEVIQRPASVVKELVENAVDAGASDIRIVIKDAGRTLIQVIDNGKGMTETDARMAFERHATSKISRADDLFTLHTMGFRGEALPSICAISHVELHTKTCEDPIGTSLRIEGSKVVGQEPMACAQGTNIMVRNIFFNVPARRKFLKSDNVELSNIMREFERLALVNNDIRMCIDTGSKTIDLRPGSFKQRIGDIWKNNLNMQLLPVDVETSLVKIKGFVSRPEFARKRNPLQYLIVNGRNMRHPYFHKAVMNAFQGLIPVDSQPCYFLKFDVDPDTIDVNIHPTKNEIKFENEQEIWPILSAAVKGALGKFSAVPSIDFTSDALPANPPREGDFVAPPSSGIDPSYNPFARKADYHPGASAPSRLHPDDLPRRANNWEALYSRFLASAPVQEEVATHPTLPEMDSADQSAICIQFANSYIITPTREGLMIVDQHRAHVKILYEDFLRKNSHSRSVTQKVMFPEVLHLDPGQTAAFDEIEPQLKELGFVTELLPDGSRRVVSIPAGIDSGSSRDILLRMIDAVSDGSLNYGMDGSPVATLFEALALMMARGAAIRRGRKMSPTEMEHLVGDLFRLPDPAITPDGKHVMRLLQEDYIFSLFR